MKTEGVACGRSAERGRAEGARENGGKGAARSRGGGEERERREEGARSLASHSLVVSASPLASPTGKKDKMVRSAGGRLPARPLVCIPCGQGWCAASLPPRIAPLFCAGGPEPIGVFVLVPHSHAPLSPLSSQSLQPPKGKKVAAVPAAAKKVSRGGHGHRGVPPAGDGRESGPRRRRRRRPLLTLSSPLPSLPPTFRPPPARPRRPTPCTRSGPRHSVRLRSGVRGLARRAAGRGRAGRRRRLSL